MTDVPMEELSDQDEQWISQLPLELQGVARRNGRALTAFVMNTGGCQFAVATMARRFQGNQELSKALAYLVSTLNDISSQYIKLQGWTSQQMADVQREVEIAHQLSQAPGPRSKRSNGGIILPN